MIPVFGEIDDFEYLFIREIQEIGENALSFLDYVARATFASNEYPGPLRHWCVGSENHVVDVVGSPPRASNKSAVQQISFMFIDVH